MSLTRNEIYTLAYQLKDILTGLHFGGIVEAGPHQWILTFANKHLLLCFNAPYLRFHLVKHHPRGHETPFTKKMAAYLENSTVKQVNCINNDRILSLTFNSRKGTYHLVGEFFPKRPNFYLLDHHMHILASLHPVEQTIYAPPENPKGGEVVHKVEGLEQASMEQKYALLEQERTFQHTLKKIHSHLSHKLKRTQQTQHKLIQTLEQCLQWPRMQHEGLLLQANLYKIHKGMKEIVVLDWDADNQEKRIALDPTLSPQDEVARRFKHSKKLKAGVEYTQKSIMKIEKDLKHIQTELKALEHIETIDGLHHFAQKAGIQLEPVPPSGRAEKALPYHEFTTRSGLKVWVGKNAKSNDLLTFSYAKGSDYWLHVADYPGSHVVLRVDKRFEPDPESLQDAIQLAIGYSKAKQQGSADVCVTQCKYVSRLGKHSPGKVQVSKHKNMHAKFDPILFQAIKDPA